VPGFSRTRFTDLAGIVTGVYQANGAIRATRWTAVTTLVSEAFPELRPS